MELKTKPEKKILPKTCPFCGRTPKVELINERLFFVKCYCGIQHTPSGTKCAATRKWNKRRDVGGIIGNHGKWKVKI